MSRSLFTVRCLLAIGVLLAPVFLLLPVVVLGDEEEETAIHCTTASTTAPEPPTTYPVEGTELVITEGLLSFSSNNDALLFSRNASLATDGTGRILVVWDGKIGYNCGATAVSL